MSAETQGAETLSDLLDELLIAHRQYVREDDAERREAWRVKPAEEAYQAERAAFVARLAEVERERGEARRALERIKGLGCEYVVACESFDIPDKRTCLERAEWEDDPCPSCIARAALAARPAETPEGR